MLNRNKINQKSVSATATLLGARVPLELYQFEIDKLRKDGKISILRPLIPQPDNLFYIIETLKYYNLYPYQTADKDNNDRLIEDFYAETAHRVFYKQMRKITTDIYIDAGFPLWLDNDSYFGFMDSLIRKKHQEKFIKSWNTRFPGFLYHDNLWIWIIPMTKLQQ